MAATRAVVRGRIQELLGDVNPSERVVVQFRYDEVIARNMHLIASRCSMPKDSVSSITLVAGTYDYAVSASLTYQHVTQMFLNSTGIELSPVPWEQFNAYYRQDTAVPLSSSSPIEYALNSNTSGLLRVRFGPTPSAADTVKVFSSSLPVLLTADSTSIPFDDDLVRGLESACAAELVLMLSPESLAKLGLAKDATSKWNSDTERAVHGYNVRQRRLGAQQDSILRYGGRRAVVGGGWQR